MSKNDPLMTYKRALYHGCGFSNEDLNRPNIAIANSFNDINPGHIHLHELAKEVKSGILEAGGLPME